MNLAFGSSTLESASETGHGGSQYSKSPAQSSSTTKNKNAESHLRDTASTAPSRGYMNDINITLPTSQSSGHESAVRAKEKDSGFSARQLQQERGEGAPSQQLHQVQTQLEAVMKEKNELLQNQERVNAQWEGRVRRLERQLQAQQKGEKPNEVRRHRLSYYICHTLMNYRVIRKPH